MFHCIKNVIAVILFLLMSLGLPLRGEGGATGPTPYPTNNADWPGKGVIRMFGWLKPHRDSFWVQREKNQGAVVFAGDSLLENWKDLGKAFSTLKLANRAIGGEVSRGMLFRYKEDVLDLHPKAIVLLIGSNDLSAYGKPDDTISNISEMLEMTQKQDSSTPVILCTIAPRNCPKAPTQPGKLDELNAKIKSLAQGRKNVVLLNLTPVFGLQDGTPDPRYYGPDLLHLALPGYVKFQEALQKAFVDLHIL